MNLSKDRANQIEITKEEQNTLEDYTKEDDMFEKPLKYAFF